MAHKAHSDQKNVYLKHLKSHITEFANHLKGADGNQGHSSYFAPCSSWTAAEKDVFFHSLSVHSRLRPDLIAEELPGKTVVDVCVYLDLLANAAKDSGHASWSRRSFEPAVEVSDKWIKFEEEQADWIAENEKIWDTARREEERDTLISNRRSEAHIIKGGRHWTTRDKEEERRKKEDLKESEMNMEALWQKEDYMRELCVDHLRVIDSILREAEERVINEDGDLQGASSVTEPSLNREHYSDSDEIGDNMSPLAKPASTASREAMLSADQAKTKIAEMSPLERRRYQKRLYMRKKRAEGTEQAASISTARIKPGRKTIEAQVANQIGSDEDQLMNVDFEATVEPERKNIIYLTGETSPENITGDGNVDDMPSRRHRHISNSQRRARGTTLPYKIREDLTALGYDAATLCSDGLDLFHMSNIGKLMSLHASLQEVGASIGTCISVSTIQLLRAHVAYFLTEVMHRTIALKEREVGAKHRSKVWKLRENQIKASTVHLALEMIGAEKNISQHFKTMIERLSTLKDADSKGKWNGDSPVPSPKGSYAGDVESNETDSADDNDSTAEDEISKMDSEWSSGDDYEEQSPQPSLPLHRALNEPFVWHTAVDLLSPSPFKHRHGNDAKSQRETQDTSLIPDDTDDIDDNAFADELIDEEELDVLDVVASKKAEDKLWVNFEHATSTMHRSEEEQMLILSSENESVASQVERKTKNKGRSLRYAEADSSSRVKSQVYVIDSD